MDAFIARQPILDRQQSLFGYELLFRSGSDNFFQSVDGDRATASLIDDTVHLHSVEKLTNGHRCFINFTRNSLLDGLYALLPPALTVVEVLESVEMDENLLEACRRVRQQGYLLALDDYILEERFEPLLSLIDVLKVDYPALSKEQHKKIVSSARHYGFRLLAEKVETPVQFEDAMSLGYDYFQGYFFCKPQLQRAKRIPKSQTQCLRLLQKVNEPNFDIESIEELLRSDLTLSYKLLRYLNSPLFQRSKPLSSIRQAIVTLGQQPLRQWVCLVAVAELSNEKPSELINTCLTRARFCEIVGGRVLGRTLSPDCFVTGMFSLLDAILDQPMQELTSQLNLADTVRFALHGQDSPLLSLLTLAKAIDNAEWSTITDLSATFRLDVEDVLKMHREAIEWVATSLR
ncbi:MAG: HDOD domain-containing protein [Planctomycetales bacterium]|nr:HDOD domain-containing protein [Planctomycetales bacterium]